MQKAEIVPEGSLPIRIAGNDINSGKIAFTLSGQLNRDTILSLKAYGYLHSHNVTLHNGTVLDECWLK